MQAYPTFATSGNRPEQMSSGGNCRPNDESLIEWNNSTFGNLFLQLPPLDADLSILGNQNKTDRKLQNLPLAKFPLWESTSPVFVVREALKTNFW